MYEDITKNKIKTGVIISIFYHCNYTNCLLYLYGF